MTTIAALFLFAQAAQASLSDQIDKALTPPTGKNGYEEYCQAAKIVSTELFAPYEGLYGSPGAMSSQAGDDQVSPAVAELRKHLQSLRYLEIKREEVEKFRDALDLVRAGSQKPVFDPRTQIKPETTFPELSCFRSISRLFASKSYVQYSEGDSLGGTQTLMDGLAFNYYISGGSIIAALVGVAGSAIMFRAFGDRLPMLSLQDSEAISTISRQILAAPLGIKAGLEMERKSSAATLAEALSNPSALKSLSQMFADSDGDKSAMSQLAAEIKSASAADLARWSLDAQAAVNEVHRAIEAKLAKPEAEWTGTDDDIEFVKKQHSAIAGVLLDVISPAFDNVLTAIARQRTQFRLLALHGMIAEYRWMNNKLPDKLADAAGASERNDPLAEREFGYERKADGYRLYSFGSKATGQIELLYRFQGSASGATTPP